MFYAYLSRLGWSLFAHFVRNTHLNFHLLLKWFHL